MVFVNLSVEPHLIRLVLPGCTMYSPGPRIIHCRNILLQINRERVEREYEGERHPSIILRAVGMANDRN